MADQTISIRVVPDGDGHRVHLQVGDGDPQDAALDYELDEFSHTADEIRNIQDGACTNETLRFVGSQLWEGLLPGEFRRSVCEAIESARGGQVTLALELPQALWSQPWEAIYDEHLRFVSCLPNVGVVHQVARQPVPDAIELGEQLSILAIIPQGSGLDVETEKHNLDVCVAPLGEAVSISYLRGVVRPDDISDRLAERRWHVVHFLGHGRVSSDNAVEIRVNDDDGGECWRNSEQFSMLFRGAQVDICVLNCCYGGSSTSVRSTDRMAPALVDAGVSSVVAMRYAITDSQANRFARCFYEKLLRGARAGRVGAAAQLARKSLQQNAPKDDARSFITPLAYTPAGDPALFRFASGTLRGDAKAQAPRAPALALPDELLRAIREHRCIPVVGTELVPPPDQRHGVALRGLPGLVERLVLEAEGELQLAEGTAPMSRLQRVTEHYQSRRQGRKVLVSVRDYFAKAGPGPLHEQVASWGSPGVFYLHFDGLLERAFPEDVSLSVVAAPDQPLADARDRSDTVLVLVRGTVTDPKTLVMSEYDHLELSGRLQRMHSSVTALTTQIDRCVLFLGTSPTDRLTRELAVRLLDNEIFVFFVSRDHAPSDTCFWRRFNVEFIEHATDDVVAALSAALEGT